MSMKGNRTTVCTTPGESGATLTIGDSPFRTLMVHSSLQFIECPSSCPCHVHRKLRSQVFIVYCESQDFAFKNFAVFSLFRLPNCTTETTAYTFLQTNLF